MMELNHIDRNLIIDYIDGRLNEAEKSSFEQRLFNDSSLKSAYESYKLAVKAVTLASENAVLNILKEEQAKLNGAKTVTLPKSNTLQTNRRWWLAAASFALVGALGLWYFTQKPNADWASIYETDFKIKHNTIARTLRGGNDNAELIQPLIEKYGEAKGTQLFEALKEYDLKHYAQAANALQNIDIQDDVITLLSANALIEINKTQEAREILKQINTQSTYYSEAQWYIIKAYLKDKDYATATDLLKKMAATPNDDFAKKASDILNKL